MAVTWKRKEVIGKCILYLGDCIDIAPVIEKGDVLLTDPPYGINYKSGHNSGRKGDGKVMARKDGDFRPIQGDNVPFNPEILLSLGLPSIIWGANHFNHVLAPRRRWLVWNKLCGKTSLPSGSDVELAWCSEAGPDRIFDHLWRGIMRAGEENIVHSAKLHPNQKPVALMSWCLSFLPAGTVIDPFMGSGTTGVAAVRAGRPFVGIELDDGYFDIACDRVAKATIQPDMFLTPRIDAAQQETLI
ncbi:DNA-methyltransferase [Agrobacterium vitis]|uniref:DNA-methyltransferase n=1 Tax=Agrobacterium vitis TaxID=373 RepID=UPI0008DBF12E|nr:site-specific DNA-methyltransferase [Agrobacterium vitis]MUO85588.1 site-specific DNA-methyltransferase [Agrobacterium vitis]